MATTEKQKMASGVNGRCGGRLSLDNINPAVRRAEYAVRGELAVTAEVIRAELQDPEKRHKWPFDKIINCNIGNPQQLGQKPLSFLRQVSALVDCPELLDNKEAAALFPQDAMERAGELLASIGNVGAYSHSQGVPLIRKSVARFIHERDGHAASPETIFLTDGASTGVKNILQMLVTHPKVGFMIPIPQYPLYSATVTLIDGVAVPYYMDENSDWCLHVNDLQTQLDKARSEGTEVRALCVINPGNPTGNVLTHQNMKDILTLCARENLILLADEVYQTNVYYPSERPWYSFKRVLMDMGKEVEGVQLFSLHSISKGMVGECGRRGGYFEVTGVDPEVVKEFYKLASISLCPNVLGQVAVDVMVRPPKPGDTSYNTYMQEYQDVYDSLKRRSILIHEALNTMAGITCNRAQGAMYVFAKVDFPKSFLSHAESQCKSPDLIYALELLKATGVCVVPGSGFGQVQGTFHIRSTFLPPEDEFKAFVGRIETFHRDWWAKWSGK